MKRAFGGDGRVTTGFLGGSARAMAVLGWQRGEVVVAGLSADEVALLRYSRRGVLDRSFGGDGRVVTAFPGRGVQAHDLLASTGGIVTVVGSVGERPMMGRYLANGSPDPSFGDAGTWMAAEDLGGPVHSVHVLRDGKVLAVGGGGGEDGDARVARYLPDGTLDQTFGGGGLVGAGLVSTRIGDYYNRVDDLVLQDDGRVFAVGESAGDGPSKLTVARDDFVGSLDPTFSQDGYLVTRFLDDRGGRAAAATLRGGRVVVVGSASRRPPRSCFQPVRDPGTDGAGGICEGRSREQELE